ncbi:MULTISPECIES: extracellular solute-binding protein [Gracilibacillus]|uniref:extracellular solute-binding protein n=1 Tax=Gracilibacillus TaxID=74385 RepID=UPI000826AEE0|nr:MULTISPECIES: extracellular solute-binding protein [Gracilibacillus]
MKKMMSRFTMIVFVLIIVAACSNESSESSSSDGNSSEERQTIEFYTNEHPSWPTDADWMVFDLMEEGGNMDIDLTIAADPYDESLNLVVASGDLPDLIRTTSSTANSYGEDGALVDLLEYIDDMPHLQAWMEEFPEEARAVLSHDGKMFMTPNEGMGETNRMLYMYRQDIFEENGLEVPQNWDELYTVLQELKSIYPDSYPLGFRNGADKLESFAPNFGTSYSYYYDEVQDEWRYGPIEDNFRALVEYFNKFYSEGLIPSDFLSTDTAQWQELMSTDTSFITHDYIGRIDEFNLANRETNPDYTLINMPPPAGFPGEDQIAFSAHENDSGYSVAVTSEHINTIIQYLDWTFSEEGRDALSWGAEGETYTEENGEKNWIEDYGSVADLRNDTGLSTYATYSWFDYDAHMELFSDEVKQAYEESPQYDAPIVPKPAFTSEEQETIAIQGESIMKHRDEEIAKFIIGDRDLAEWDDYVQEMENLGVQDLVDIHAEAYQRMQEVELN